MRWTILCCALLAAGCAQELGDLRLSDEHQLAEPKLEFLGVAGVLIRWRGEGVLFDPFFSRPTIPELFWLSPDTDEIDRRMPPAADVTMLLLGHAHYDHALDVAWVMQKHTPQAITAMPIQSMHAPNPLTPLMSGAYTEDLTQLPRGFWN